MANDAGWEHTRAEWDQAWNQVRHFETMRGQWLGFFFTAVLGVIAIVAPRLDTGTSKAVVVIAILAVVFETWSAALYLAVARLNEVHRYNDHIIFAIRDATISSPPAAVDLTWYRRPPAPPRGGRLGSLATTKSASELVVLFGVYLFTATLAANLADASTASKVSTGATAIAAVATGVGVLIAVFCGWVRRR
jgi:hypothetical protein